MAAIRFLLAGMVIWVALNGAKAQEKDKKPAAPKVKITLGKDTTFITEPLDKEGFVDYAKALNLRLSKGVTPENNANVLLMQAFGPRPEGATLSPEYYRWLGIQAPPEKGDYLVNVVTVAKKRGKAQDGEETKLLYDQFERAMHRPWAAKEFPDLAVWLEANEKPLELVIKASLRPRYFNPIIAPQTKEGQGELIGALLPTVQKCREVASALTLRAMLRLHQGKAREAWQDLQATHRLGRLLRQSGTLIENLVGIAIDSIASSGDLVYLEHAKLTPQQITQHLQDLKKLPPLSSLEATLDHGERYVSLDAVQWMARRGNERPKGGSGYKSLLGLEGMLPASASLNWDLVLRKINLWYDRMNVALKIPDPTARGRRMAQLEDDLKRLKGQLRPEMEGLKLLGWAMVSRTEAQNRVSEKIGEILVTLLMPALWKVEEAAQRNIQIQNNLHLAFALKAFHKDKGKYPEKLSELAPRYLPSIPRDIFSGTDLIYQAKGNQVLLYSVGQNRRDDRGQSPDDRPRGDDLVIRFPYIPPEERRPKEE